MLLQDIFSVSRIKAQLEAEDKDELFEELVDVLARGYPTANRGGILAAIQEREAKMSTGIKNGIAIPHGKAEGLNGIYGALGISEKGIDYDALDGEPVYLVFLVVSSPDDAELHLNTLKKIAMLLEHPDFYADIIKAETEAKAHSVLKRYEEIILCEE
ncbi:MAG: PTS sugar transporter subunit IIA [Spirochaetales bacterium]|jgi:PTS system fructose-specific IIC component/PTS system nitrogen regulatory IIA component|nr:PTS sugar transporter subunit IIA [Spirochaetales bacterium]